LIFHKDAGQKYSGKMKKLGWKGGLKRSSQTHHERGGLQVCLLDVVKGDWSHSAPVCATPPSNAPDAVIGELGGGGEEEDEDEDEEEDDDAGAAGDFTVEEVAKHTTKEDCWVILHGRVLNVTTGG